MYDVASFILAAGQGKRMESNLPKVVHLLHEKPLIVWVLESLARAGIPLLFPVVAPGQQLVSEAVFKAFSVAQGTADASADPKVPGRVVSIHNQLARIQFAQQDQPLGTAHAVQCALRALPACYPDQHVPDNVIVVVACGDTPAIQPDTIVKLLAQHRQQGNAFTLQAFRAADPTGYGRVVLSPQGAFERVREHKDCSPSEAQIDLCNAGLLCGNYVDFKTILPLVENNNAAHEFYLTDVPVLAKERGLSVGVAIGGHESEFLGINTKQQLSTLERVLGGGV